jgi:hypothetical protein
MRAPKSKPLPPILPRTTTWSVERVAALPQLLDVRQLLANAERLGETDLAVICTTEITKRRREALRAPKPPGWKPKPKAKKAPVEQA